jgi:ketosteroid isomerase-like protein
VGLSEDAVRQWPQRGELLRGRRRIAEVKAHFAGLRLGVGRRHALGDTVVVEWGTDYGDGLVYRNVSIAELRDGEAVRVTDYWVNRSRGPRGAGRWRSSWRCRPTAPGRQPRP